MRPEIVDASLHSSVLWNKCKVLKLTKNMRLSSENNSAELKDMREFAEWILKIGEGKINEPNDGEADLYSSETLNTLKVPGFPKHVLSLKPGVLIMLLRNIDQTQGLCNGTRLQVERLGDHTIKARIITRHSFGKLTYIPRMIVAPCDNKIAVKFQRRQFLVAVCYAMIINKSQGQSLSNVGLYLRKLGFTHGKLYVAVSRVTTKKGLKVIILDNDGNDSNTTKNVVYKEVLRSI
ncbi:uncharacterized protein [Rutidosis leptorrhynchoides]|uniref:uncharacterized protein n=1 Tax=Rutidosis leptorrhynchoides TaxID=125765 RepID=UPI003A9A3E61